MPPKGAAQGLGHNEVSRGAPARDVLPCSAGVPSKTHAYDHSGPARTWSLTMGLVGQATLFLLGLALFTRCESPAHAPHRPRSSHSCGELRHRIRLRRS